MKEYKLSSKKKLSSTTLFTISSFSFSLVIKSLGQEDLWRRKWQPTPVFLPGKSHGTKSLVGYSPCGCKESDTTEQLHFT